MKTSWYLNGPHDSIIFFPSGSVNSSSKSAILSFYISFTLKVKPSLNKTSSSVLNAEFSLL